MSKAGAGVGGSIGGLFGLIVGMLIPSEAEIVAPLLTRITGNAILQDPTGFFIAGFYTIIAVAICGTIGTLIWGFLIRKWKLKK